MFASVKCLCLHTEKLLGDVMTVLSAELVKVIPDYIEHETGS